MAVSLKHSFVSAKLDDADATLVRTSNWNEEHALTMATNKLLGRGTAATGAVEEITLGTNLSLSGTTLNSAVANDSITYANLQNTSAASVLIGRGSAAGAGDPQEITLGANLSMTGTVLSAALGGTLPLAPPQGRLTLTTSVPVMISTVSGATTIRYTPYCGNQLPIWNGSTMAMTTFAELSNVTTASSVGSAGPAAVAASSVYDLFVWSNAGTVTLTRGTAWTNDTTRSAGTALVMVGGVLLNNASITNGPAASRGTYVGTVRSNASSQIDWIFGGDAVGGAAGFFGVWNCYNRVQVATIVRDTTASWTYSGALHPPNGSTTMRVSYVSGLAEDSFTGAYCATSSGDASNLTNIGVGYDSTTTASGVTASNQAGAAIMTQGISKQVSFGFHFFQALEATTSGTLSFISNTLGIRTGFTFDGRM